LQWSPFPISSGLSQAEDALWAYRESNFADHFSQECYDRLAAISPAELRPFGHVSKFTIRDFF
ncbi:MAG: hypothetical protein DME76_13615, partial [Verrucomicrobia bacterium]